MATVESIKKMKKKRRKGRALKFLISFFLLAFISLAAAVLITNNGKLELEGLTRLFSGSGDRVEAAEFIFDAASEKDLASFDGGLAVASMAGLEVIDRYGDTSFSETIELAKPTVTTGGDSGAVYDLGGYNLKLFDRSGVVKSLTAKGKIISARLNANGWLTLCTQESGFKGLVTVYNAKGNEVYNWETVKGYTLSAEVSPNNKKLAVLTLAEDGSRIVFFELNSTEEKSASTLSATLVTEIAYINGDSVLAVSENMLTVVNEDGSSNTLIDYAGKYLAGYSIDSHNFTALVLNDYLVGDQGSIVTVDRSGKTLGTFMTDRKVLSLSADGDYLAVLFSDGLVIYDENLEEYASFGETTGAVGTIMRPDGTALSITQYSAEVKKSVAD